ncbi:hypothetical protein VTK26DRAFT_1670 [Humicola hyalothermophila]
MTSSSTGYLSGTFLMSGHIGSHCPAHRFGSPFGLSELVSVADSRVPKPPKSQRHVVSPLRLAFRRRQHSRVYSARTQNAAYRLLVLLLCILCVSVCVTKLLGPSLARSPGRLRLLSYKHIGYRSPAYLHPGLQQELHSRYPVHSIHAMTLKRIPHAMPNF